MRNTQTIREQWIDRKQYALRVGSAMSERTRTKKNNNELTLDSSRNLASSLGSDKFRAHNPLCSVVCECDDFICVYVRTWEPDSSSWSVVDIYVDELCGAAVAFANAHVRKYSHLIWGRRRTTRAKSANADSIFGGWNCESDVCVSSCVLVCVMGFRRAHAISDTRKHAHTNAREHTYTNTNSDDSPQICRWSAISER